MKIFLASLKSPKTKDNYLKSLERFRSRCKIKSYDEFVQLDPKEIQRVVEDYLLSMHETDHPNSVPTFYYPIQTFLEMNDVIINFKKMRRLFPERVKTAVERGWTTEEIQSMLKVADDLRTIAALHLENASGGRIGLYDGLLIKHLIPINDEQFGKCYAITGYADSLEEYTTFLTPEAANALDEYHDSRKKKGEIFTPETPVFIKKRKSGICNPANLANSIYYLALKAGLRDPATKKGRRFAIPTNHGFRHRFNEIVKSSNLLNPHTAERLLSHTSKLIPMDTIYYNPNMETIFHEYKKIIPLITINNVDEANARASAALVKRSEHEASLVRIEKLERQLEKVDRKELIPEN